MALHRPVELARLHRSWHSNQRCRELLPVSVNVNVGGLRYLVSPFGERVKLASRFENPVLGLGS